MTRPLVSGRVRTTMRKLGLKLRARDDVELCTACIQPLVGDEIRECSTCGRPVCGECEVPDPSDDDRVFCPGCANSPERSLLDLELLADLGGGL